MSESARAVIVPAKRSNARFAVLAWMCGAATISYICRNSIQVAESTIRADLGLTEQEMGYVLSVFFASYAVLQIPTGQLGQHLGTRRALALFSTLWSAATALMAVSTGMLLLVFSRVANGAAQAGLFPATTNTVSRWFSTSERSIANGSLTSFMSAGGALGGWLVGWLLDLNVSWQLIFLGFSALGVLWGIGFYAWFRDEPEDHSGVNEQELEWIRQSRQSESDSASQSDTPSAEDLATPWIELITSPAMWLICTQQFFRAAGYIFFATWFATYLQEVFSVSITQAGALSALPQMGVVGGGLAGGVFSDWIFRRTGSLRLSRQGVAVAALVGCITCTLVAYMLHDATSAVLVISAGMFCFAVGGPASYSITIDMGGRHVPTVFSTMNMCGNFGAMLFPLCVPIVRAWYGWEAVLLLFAGTFLAATVCWLLLNPNGSIFDQALIRRRVPDAEQEETQE